MTRLRVQDYSVIGDGETDSSAGLKAIRDHIRAGPDQEWHVDFEHGHYGFVDNTWWLFGDRSVALHFNNSKIECISTHASARSYGMIARQSPFEFWGDGPFVEQEAVLPTGTLMYSAAMGDREIDLYTALPDGPPQPGEVLLVGGLVQQIRETDDVLVGEGWPANLRFFGYHTVESVPAPDHIRLVEPLRYDYDQRWPDFPHRPLDPAIHGERLFGAPRVWKASLSGYAMTRSLRIESAHFLGNRNQPEIRTPCPFHGILHAVIEDCIFGPELAPSNAFNKRIEFRNCRFLARHEDDGTLLAASYEIEKLIEHMSFDDRCEFMGNISSHGGGVLELDQRGKIYGRWEGVPRGSRFDCQVWDRVILNRGAEAASEPFALQAKIRA